MLIQLGIPINPNDGLEYPLAQPEDLYRHILIIGSTGTGKTTYLQNIINQVNENSCIVLDPSGNLAEKIAPLFPSERLIYVDKNNPICLNPLTLPYDYSVIANDLVQTINKSVKSVSPVQVEVSVLMRMLIRRALMAFKPEQFTMRYLSDFMEYEDLRHKANDIFWQHFDDTLKPGWYKNREQVESAKRISARLSLFIDDKTMNRFVEGENQFNLEEIARNKKAVIFNLAGIDDENTAFIGGLVANQVKSYYVNLTQANPYPLFFFVDECHLFINEDYKRFLVETRKHKISCSFAIHSFSQFDKELGSMLMACHIKVCLGAEDEDLDRITKSFNLKTDDFRNLEKHEAYVKVGHKVQPILCFPPLYSPDFIPKQDVRTKEYNFLGNGWIHL